MKKAEEEEEEKEKEEVEEVEDEDNILQPNDQQYHYQEKKISLSTWTMIG